MKVALLVVLSFVSSFAIPALATSIPPPTVSFSLSGVGSSMIEVNTPFQTYTQLFSNEITKGFRYSLSGFSPNLGGPDFSGTFYAILGTGEDAINLHGGFGQAVLSNGILTTTFSGIEFMRLGPGNWIYYDVTGALAEGVNLTLPTTGSITLSSAVFEGKYYVAPEPSTWIMLASGLGLIAGLKRYCKIPPRNSTV